MPKGLLFWRIGPTQRNPTSLLNLPDGGRAVGAARYVLRVCVWVCVRACFAEVCDVKRWMWDSSWGCPASMNQAEAPWSNGHHKSQMGHDTGSAEGTHTQRQHKQALMCAIQTWRWSETKICVCKDHLYETVEIFMHDMHTKHATWQEKVHTVTADFIFGKGTLYPEPQKTDKFNHCTCDKSQTELLKLLILSSE